MKHIIRLGMLSATVVLSIAGTSVPVMAVGAEMKQLIIAEVSPESATSASEEYVELFNPNADAVDVAGWQLQYRSYSHPNDDNGSWSIRAILGCSSTKVSDCTAIPPLTVGGGDTLRLSSYETGEGIEPLTPGMSMTGGEVRLFQPGRTGTSDTIHDMVGYGAAKGYEGATPAGAPKAGRSIIRTQDNDGAYVDTDQNGADFVLSPEEVSSAPQEPGATTIQGGGESQPEGITPPKTYGEAELTEILPDPASPQTDSADEFIELYNPYGEELDITGYVLKTGTNWSHQYAIGQVTIGPYDYVALMSVQTHLSLSNSGSGVRLYDPNGKLLFEVPSYGTAKSGNSWVRNAQGQWVWTTKPTPGEANIVDVPVEAQVAKASITAKKPTAKATSSSKKPSVPKPTTAVKGAATLSPTSSEPSAANNLTGLWVMAGAGILGAGYGIFEYRQDIADFFRRRWQAITSLKR